MALIDKLTNLADAIREQTGKTGLLSLDAMVSEIKNIDFSKIIPINVVPDTSSSFVYDGTTKTPVWQNYDPEQLTMSGTASAINAGTYTVYFTPKAGYSWVDESVDSKSVTWSIEKQTISAVPSQSGTLTYSGSSQSPSWSNYNSTSLTIGGTTSSTNAGSYTATFTPKSNYKWSDNTTAAKSVTWAIGKATGSLSLSATSGTITGKNSTKTFTVTRSGDGKISVSSSNTSIATVSVSGTTVTITSKGYGSATVTVSVAAGTNHNAPSNKTYSVTVQVLYLYNAGNENTSVTGGWIGEAVYIGNWDGGLYKSNPVVTKNSSNMVIRAGGSPSGGVVRCKNAINLTNFTTLKFEGSVVYWEDYNETRRNLCVWSTVPTYYWDQKKAWANLFGSGSISKSVDVSGLSGNQYIGFGLCIAKDVTVNKVWLE